MMRKLLLLVASWVIVAAIHGQTYDFKSHYLPTGESSTPSVDEDLKSLKSELKLTDAEVEHNRAEFEKQYRILAVEGRKIDSRVHLNWDGQNLKFKLGSPDPHEKTYRRHGVMNEHGLLVVGDRGNDILPLYPFDHEVPTITMVALSNNREAIEHFVQPFEQSFLTRDADGNILPLNRLELKYENDEIVAITIHEQGMRSFRRGHLVKTKVGWESEWFNPDGSLNRTDSYTLKSARPLERIPRLQVGSEVTDHRERIELRPRVYRLPKYAYAGSVKALGYKNPIVSPLMASLLGGGVALALGAFAILLTKKERRAKARRS